jgi:predicted transcriptional regulator
MAEKSTGDKYPLTIHLSADLAKRLMAAAEARKRTPADLAADLLDRNLPQVQAGGKDKIPYT